MDQAATSDIYVVVWEIPYEGQNVEGAYLSEAEAEARIAELRGDDAGDQYGWIRFSGGKPVESTNDVYFHAR